MTNAITACRFRSTTLLAFAFLAFTAACDSRPSDGHVVEPTELKAFASDLVEQ